MTGLGGIARQLLRHLKRHGPRSSFRYARDWLLLKRSPDFDEEYYLSTYPDVGESGVDPVAHYLDCGAAEGRDPSPRFSTSLYLDAYPDVRVSESNPLVHFLRHGKAEGRDADPAGRSISHREPVDRALIEREIASFPLNPTISILVPTFNTDPGLLAEMVMSVLEQIYPSWELILSDDGSTTPATLDYLRMSIPDDPRVRVLFHEKNAGISKATNAALSAAQGEFIALLDHDDLLTPDALFEVAKRLNTKPATDAVYSDHDKIGVDGETSEPFFKPDWSPEYFLGVMYVGHLLVVRRSLAVEAGGFDSQYDTVQDYEFMLRVSEKTNAVEHIAKVLYHWRAIPGSVAHSLDAKPDVEEKQQKAVQAHFDRKGIAAIAESHPSLPHRIVVRPAKPDSRAAVSIVISTKDAPHDIARCLDSIFEKSTAKNAEVIVVDSGTTDPGASAAMGRHPVKRVSCDRAVNHTEANNRGAGVAEGEFLIFLSDAAEVVTPDWIEILLFQLSLDRVGAAGPLLLDPGGKVWQAGMALGLRGSAGGLMGGYPRESEGYAGSLSCTREVSAVAGICLATKRADYLEAGRFDERYAKSHADIDYCLKHRAAGKRILFTPQAELIFHGVAPDGAGDDGADRALFLESWREAVEKGDPYHRNLSLAHGDYACRKEALQACRAR